MSEVITERGDPRDRITNQLPLPKRAEFRDGNGVVIARATQPLLSTEKPKRWPEDFRGFGTNVKPKKQR